MLHTGFLLGCPAKGGGVDPVGKVSTHVQCSKDRLVSVCIVYPVCSVVQHFSARCPSNHADFEGAGEGPPEV